MKASSWRVTSAARRARLDDLGDLGPARVGGLQAAHQELAESDDAGHHVVDLVRHAARQAPGGLHPLRPPELLLHSLALGHVAIDAAEPGGPPSLAVQLMLPSRVSGIPSAVRSTRSTCPSVSPGLGAVHDLADTARGCRDAPGRGSGGRPGSRRVEPMASCQAGFTYRKLPSSVGGADQVAGVLEQVAVAGLAVPERLLGPLSLAHVPRIEADADDRATLVHDRRHGWSRTSARPRPAPRRQRSTLRTSPPSGRPKAVGGLRG